MLGNIMYFKLVSGEHVISFVDAADEEYVLLHKPLQLFLQNGMNGAAVRVAKWIPFVDQSDITIKIKHVLMHAEPSSDIADYYLEAIDALEGYDQPDIQDIDLEDEQLEEDVTMALYEKFANTSIMVH